MKISLNWLKEYVETDLSADEIGAILTETGLEVESIEKIEMVKGGLEGVVIGEVLTCEKHPDADKLKVTNVSIGGEILQIVCGAPNVAVGQKVAVATVGCTLYPTPEEPLKIKISKIRGVDSYGMLCAEDELGIGKSHAGIMVLDPSTVVGKNLAEVLELEDDYQLEIGLTPNRADAMGHIGVGRDLIAYLNVHKNTNVSLKLPQVSDQSGVQELSVSVSVENSEKCPRYMGQTIKGVTIKPSPAWLQNRLRAVGLTPINNVVDVTNYVMRELGTPLHAFDIRSLGGKVTVRTAKEGEKIVTLDGTERTLSGEDLMITNGTESLCIAGVFGGLASGVKDDTTDIFIESAYFDPVSVRKTAKRHGLNTDASFRFERGVDPALTDYALKRAVDLIIQVAGGSIGMDIVEVYPHKIVNKTLQFSCSYCNRLIGTHIPNNQIKEILALLDITTIKEEGDQLTLSVPAYRVDVTREADVVEEVLRIYGFNNVPLPEKLNSSMVNFPKPDSERVQEVLSEMLVGKGFSETMNNSLSRSSYIEKFGVEALKVEHNVPILNPLSKDLDVMRQTLLFNALETAEYNQNRQRSDLRFFEFGKVYFNYPSGYAENKRLMLVISGRRHEESWNAGNEQFSYYSLKGTVNAVFSRLGLGRMLKETPLKRSLFQDGVQLNVLKHKIGEMGWVSPGMRKAFGLKNEILVADLDWDVIISCQQYAKIKFTELPKTFAVRRDFSLLLDEAVTFGQIEEAAMSCDKKLLKEVGLFDVYEGKNLEEGKKSYAVSFRFQDPEATLKDEQIDKVMDRIRLEIEEKLGAQLR